MKIELKNVSKKFKDVSVLENINMKFEEGKIYGLIGRNGSGKSVLLKMICAFYETTTGEILFDGKNIIEEKSFPPSTRALIEKPHFLPDISGKKNLMLLVSIQNLVGEKEVDKVLEEVGLAQEANKKYHKYSLGMKQKLGIAQVLVENPKVLIFDEPFNGLDNKSIQHIREILLEEKKRKKIIILATHVREDIEKLCDEVYKIDDGKIEKVPLKQVNQLEL